MRSVKKPFITYILVTLNILVFVIMTLNGGTTNIENLIRFGASYQPLILAGQWYRLLTPMFIHIGFEHLFLNMITLYFCGTFLEQIIGSWRFLIVYIIAGVGGNLLSASLAPNVVSAGASTSIFGLFGTFVMIGLLFRQLPYFKNLGRQFGILIVLNLVFALFPGSGIDISGHIGGLITGFLGAVVVGMPKGTINSKLVYRISALVCLLGYGMATIWWLING